MTASVIRKMQVPTYWPECLGVHAVLYNDVVVEVKNTIDMPDVSIAIVSDEEEEEPMSMDEEVGIGMAEVAIEAPDAPIVVLTEFIV